MVEESDRQITVIIPTLASRERKEHIRRAIDSVLDQRDVRAVPLVVVNGTQADPELLRALRSRTDLRLDELPLASLPGALAAGRRLVTTPWFAELDDDDLLLPHALALRLRSLEIDPALDAVISNGILRGAGEDRPSIVDFARAAANPLSALGAGNWLYPGAALFRTASVPIELFDGIPSYLEWTYLAARLAQTCRLAFLPQPSFIHYLDTPHGIWGSTACMLGQPGALERLLALDLPADLRGIFARHLAEACHRAADVHLHDGRLSAALRLHLRSLNSASGWRYLPFTAKLLLSLVRA